MYVLCFKCYHILFSLEQLNILISLVLMSILTELFLLGEGRVINYFFFKFKCGPVNSSQIVLFSENFGDSFVSSYTSANINID